MINEDFAVAIQADLARTATKNDLSVLATKEDVRQIRGERGEATQPAPEAVMQPAISELEPAIELVSAPPQPEPGGNAAGWAKLNVFIQNR